MQEICLDSICLNNKKFVVKKENHIVNGENHSRSVFFDHEYFYKVWPEDYVKASNILSALNSGFIDKRIAPGLESLIVNSNKSIVGYIYKKCDINTKDIFFYKDFYNYIIKKTRQTQFFHYDLAPSNIVICNGEPGLIDLESFYHISFFPHAEKNGVTITPERYYRFIREEYDKWLIK